MILFQNKNAPRLHIGLFCLLLFALYACLTPKRSFEKTKVPFRPDYANEKYWAALPAKKDSADAIVPNSGLTDNQANAKVDVFFIHPTSYIAGHHWNASFDYKNINKRTDKGSIRNQASVFNGSCRVYAPRYRQAVLYAYADKKGNAVKAFDTAYSDVKNAFEYYLKHHNNGRPFIIASHSQGTGHAVRLLHDYFDNNAELRKQLIAAYLIGGTFPKNAFNNIPTCDSPTQTGCVISWNSVRWGETRFHNKEIPKEGFTCVNPLTWHNNTDIAPADKNEGSLPFSFKKFDKGIADAKCTESGILWVHAPQLPGYVRGKSFHVEDYNLFYMNIRKNVQQRIDQYFLEMSDSE